jgi:hypothetical protein
VEQTPQVYLHLCYTLTVTMQQCLRCRVAELKSSISLHMDDQTMLNDDNRVDDVLDNWIDNDYNGSTAINLVDNTTANAEHGNVLQRCQGILAATSLLYHQWISQDFEFHM